MGRISGFLSLKTSADFNRVYKRGRYAHTSSFVLYYLKGEIDLFGVVASKKVGNAVKRNTAKRRLRALFSHYRDQYPSGSYILVAKESLNNETYSRLEAEFLLAMTKVAGVAIR